MKHYAGIVRDEESMKYCLGVLEEYIEICNDAKNYNSFDVELQNMLLNEPTVSLSSGTER